MKKLVNGIHHVALDCAGTENYEEAKRFYGNVLGLEKVREWPAAVMFDTGSGILEIFHRAAEKRVSGTILHFAFATDDPDACISAVRAAGYEVTREPQDLDIPSDPVYPVRVAFCYGPAGEVIEFFHVRCDD